MGDEARKKGGQCYGDWRVRVRTMTEPIAQQELRGLS